MIDGDGACESTVGGQEFRAILRDYAFNASRTSYETYLEDELPYLNSVPNAWIWQAVEASRWDGVEDSYRFTKWCLKFLVQRAPGWEGLPGLAARLLALDSGFLALTSVAEYFQEPAATVTTELATAVTTSFGRVPRWLRWVYWIDGPIRVMVRRANDCLRADQFARRT